MTDSHPLAGFSVVGTLLGGTLTAFAS